MGTESENANVWVDGREYYCIQKCNDMKEARNIAQYAPGRIYRKIGHFWCALRPVPMDSTGRNPFGNSDD